VTRDPRRDPQPGDVVERAGLRYTVVAVDLFGVTFDLGPLGRSSVELPQWRRLMRSARVLPSPTSATT
jgi:hypothetical protein